MSEAREAPVRRRAGKEGRAFFESLVRAGLPSWRLESLCFTGEVVEARLASGAGALSLELAGPGADPGRFPFISPCASMRSADRGPERGAVEAGVPGGDELRSLFAVLGRIPFDKLLARLKADALFHSDPHGPQPPPRLDRFHRVWDHAGDWWKFFYPRKPFLEEEVVLGESVAVVSHGTRECRTNGPQQSVASLRLFADDRQPPSRRTDHYFDTDLGEKDVARGRTLGALAAKMKEASAARPGVIHLMTTCLPELLGDDPGGIIARVRKASGASVVWTAKTRDSGMSFNGVVDRVLRRMRWSRKRDPKSVILAGVPSRAAAEELGRLLGSLGLRVTGTLFPNLDPRSLSGARSAGSLVWADPVGWEKISDDVFIRSGLAVVRCHPPFGVAGTRAWLGRAASVLGLDGSAGEAAVSAHAAALSRLRDSCGARVAALIGDRPDLDCLVRLGRPMGFSVAAVLAEMGFQVRCFLRAGKGAKVSPEPSGFIEFRSFRTAAELDGLLSEGVDLAFTHFNHDPRLSRHRIAGFCERAFEPGVEGFLRSGRALIELCETRPFPRHGRYLGAWRKGARSSEGARGR